jgi:hypothetical protein
MGLLEGSDRCPPEFLEAEDENKKKISVPKPAYHTWVTRNQQVVSFLVNSLAKDVLPHVFGLSTAAVVWRALNDQCCPVQVMGIQHPWCPHKHEER